jgi:hypothetical protein
MLLLYGITNFFGGLGGIEFYVPKWICANEAKQVIREYSIGRVHSCKVKTIIYNNQKTKLVEIEYEPASLCNMGCVYNFRQVIVHGESVIQFPVEQR